jgi:hypothetical protein
MWGVAIWIKEYHVLWFFFTDFRDMFTIVIGSIIHFRRAFGRSIAVLDMSIGGKWFQPTKKKVLILIWGKPLPSNSLIMWRDCCWKYNSRYFGGGAGCTTAWCLASSTSTRPQSGLMPVTPYLFQQASVLEGVDRGVVVLGL